MFVAQRYIRAQASDGTIVSYLPGDVIPDFNAWPELSRRAHLNQHLVEKLDELPVTPAPTVETPKVETPTVEVIAQPEAATPDVAYSTYCAACDRSFKDQVGLRVHNTRVHRQTARV